MAKADGSALAARSYLYVPGDQHGKLAKAAGVGADAVILDLEDAVAPGAKAAAREEVARFLAGGPTGPQWWVRVNADVLSDVERDLTALAGGGGLAGLTGVVVPKAEPDLLRHVDDLLTTLEAAHGVTSGTMWIIGLIETALGLARTEQVAASPRVLRLGIGEADLAATLALQPGPEREELWPYRAGVVLASAVAGILPPMGPVETQVRDLEWLESTTRLLVRQGFRARTSIHPTQVAVVNDVLTPSAEEVRAAHEVVTAYEQATAGGRGVSVTYGGQFIDLAVVRGAREVLGRAR